MKRYTVEFTPESDDQLAELYRYIATQASPEVASEYTEAVIAFCEGLGQFPERGTPRDDIRPALRVTNYRRRTVVAYSIQGDRVSILGVFSGGKDYESALQQDPEDGSRRLPAQPPNPLPHGKSASSSRRPDTAGLLYAVQEYSSLPA